MKRIKWVCNTIGSLLLLAGIGGYVVLVMTRAGSLFVCFAALMTSLFFFNLPTVLYKRRLRREMRVEGAPRDQAVAREPGDTANRSSGKM